MAITKIITPDLIDLKDSQLASGVATTYAVTVVAVAGVGNRYFVDGVQTPNIVLIPGTQYIITQDDVSNASHPILLSTSIANTGVYSTGVVYSLNGVDVSYSSYISGFAAATQRKITITLSSPPATLYYVCYYHQNMGNTVITVGGALNTDGIVLAKGTTASASSSVEYIIVAGGGAAGADNDGGGGAGGLLNDTINIVDGTTFTLTIGEGGTGIGTYPTGTDQNGDNSVLTDSASVTLTSIGGGRPGQRGGAVGQLGGSGGGGGAMDDALGGDGGAGTTGQGNAGGNVNANSSPYAGAGGGGAGGSGANGQAGAAGIGVDKSSVINSTNAAAASVGEVSGSGVWFAGGGGAGSNTSGTLAGGLGGGGDGVIYPNNGGNGTANTGGGGGGAGSTAPARTNIGGSGGRGVIILRYNQARTVTTSGFTAEAGPYTEGDYKVLVLKEGTGTVVFSNFPAPTGRPTTNLSNGEFRYNTTTKKIEFYDGVDWFALTSTTAVPQTGTTGACNYPTTATALYQFENNADDTCGTYNGTFTTPSYTTGKFGQAASFNGSSSYIDTSLTIPVNSSFSTSCWINISSAQSQGFIIAEGDWNAWSTASFGIAFTGSSIIELSIGNNGGSGGTQVQSSSSISLNNWTNIVGVIDIGNTLKLYINGIEAATRSLSSNNRNAGSPPGFKFGGANSSYYFNGLIDQVRIFPNALTVDQVSALYTETAP